MSAIENVKSHRKPISIKIISQIKEAVIQDLATEFIHLWLWRILAFSRPTTAFETVNLNYEVATKTERERVDST